MRTVPAGLVTGLIINLFDVPNSILLGAPLLNAQLRTWGVTSQAMMPAYMVTLHFALGVALVWVYGQLRRAGSPPLRAWVWSTLVLIGLNRLFSFGSVMIGTLSVETFLAFSWAFIAGTALGCAVGARLVEPRLGGAAIPGAVVA